MKIPLTIEEINKRSDPNYPNYLKKEELNFILDQLKDYVKIKAAEEVLAAEKTLFDFSLMLCCLGTFFVFFAVFHAIIGNYSYAFLALGPASASLVGGLGFYARLKKFRSRRRSHE
jgi:hypothetical protein